MKIKFESNIPLNVTVNQNKDGTLDILLDAKDKKTLSSVTPGETVKLGNREYIVLGHGKETTAVITKEPVKNMKFGKSEDYTKSYVREYCKGEFYKELVNTVGKDNIGVLDLCYCGCVGGVRPFCFLNSSVSVS